MSSLQQLFATGFEHHTQGRLQAAEQIYRQILAIQPDQPDTIHLLGVIAHQVGNHAAAIELIRRAITLKGTEPAYHNNLGNACAAIGTSDEAITCFRKAIELNPDYVEAHSNLANALKSQGRLDDAVVSYRRLRQLQPNSPDVCNNLGTTLADRGRLDEAIVCYKNALELDPELAVVHYNLGNALNGTGKFEEAVAFYRRALERQPGCLPMLDQLIRTLQQLCLWDDLVPLMDRAIAAVDSDAPDSINNLMPPFAFLTMSAVTTSAQQLRCASRWVSQTMTPFARTAIRASDKRERERNGRIRIGYLSADFRTHPVADLIVGLLETHDRNRFEVFGYSIGPDDGSAIRRRIESAVDRFIDLKDVSFVDSAERIASDGIDILVDLTGYTQYARTQILALRPAPVQVNYLGYAGTMGASFIDYVLVDEYVVPRDQQPFFTEMIVHLPGCYLVCDSQRTISSRTPSRTECGLPETGFVFCSFNQHQKITPQIFDIWMDLLKELPDSVLWIPEGNRIAPKNLQREAERRGVSAARLILAPRMPSLAEHLARYRLVDLFLDTYPFNAHTTASDALWSGCPVLTLSGETFVSRVAGSLLKQLDLPELIASNLRDYRDKALQLAREPERLRGIRQRLKENRDSSGLFDIRRFSVGIEAAFAGMVDGLELKKGIGAETKGSRPAGAGLTKTP